MPNFGAALAYLDKMFKGEFREAESVQTVGTATLKVFNYDSERVSATFVNLGATVLYIAPTAEVAALRGMRLAPSGGTISMNIFQDGNLPTCEWFVMGSAAGGTLYTLIARRETETPPETEG